MRKDFVLMATFQYQSELLILRSLLEYEMIYFQIQDEHIVSMDPFATIAYGGIKLWVHEKDVERADKIINDFNSPLKKI
jgi:hypothetical protein